MTRSWSLLALAASAALAGCSASARSGAGENDATSEEGSAPDDSFVAITSPNNPSWICSGSVIAPTVVLTAAHCVEGGNTDKTGWSFEVFVGEDRDNKKTSDRVIKVKSFHFPKLYRETIGAMDDGDSVAPAAAAAEPGEEIDDVDGDLAVLILERPTTRKPVPWNDRALTPAVVGKKVRFLGYGRDKPKNDPSGKNGLRKNEQTTIAELTPGTVAIPKGPANPCNGDSGGPMLLELDGVETIIGVGHVAFDGETCRAGADYQRTDRYAEFIKRYTE